MTRPSRRSFLGAAAGMSAAALGLGAFTDPGRAYTNSTTITTATDIDLHVDWRSEYNGSVVESRDPGAGIPLNIDGALPGDSGKLLFRIQASTDEDVPTRVAAVFDDSAADSETALNAENGRNQPEIEAGDTTEETGELLDNVTARAWYDVGVLGVSFLGGCDGVADPTETLVDGTLREVVDRFMGEDEDEPKGVPLPSSGCLGPEEEICFGIEWHIDRDVGNVIQGDSVEFPIALEATVCDST